MVGHRPRLIAAAGATLVALAFLAVFVVWPLWELGALALGREASAVPLSVSGPLWTTLRLALGGVVLAFAVGLPAAWALYRVPWRGRHAVRALATVPFVLPTVVVGAAFTALLGPAGPLGSLGWDRTEGAIVAALAFYNVAIVIRVVGSAWEGLDPRLAAAARTLGASPWRVLTRVTLPMLRDALASAASLVFLFCATSFGVVIVLGGGAVRTLETEVYVRVSQLLDLRAAAVLSLVQLAIVGLVIVLTARSRDARHTRASVHAAEQTKASRGMIALAGLALVPLAALHVPPLVALLERSLRARDTHGLQHFRALFSSAAPGARNADFLSGAASSIGYAIAATAVALAVAGCVAFVAARGFGSRWLDGLFLVSMGISAVTLGLGYLVGLRPVFGSGALLLIMAQAVIALPLAARTLVPTARSLDPRRVAAAATLGASPWQRWIHIWLPHMRGAIVVSAALAFTVAIGEFGAATFLTRPDAPTVPVLIARLLGRPGPDSVGMGFAAAVVLGVIVAGISLLVERIRSRSEVTGW